MASMCFGYSTINTTTGIENTYHPVNTACWAALKWPNSDIILKEVVWVPEKGHTNHVKVLLPLLFPDIAYEEFETTRGKQGTSMHYAVRFPGLEDVYRSNFMFRMFVIRNINRDPNCTKSFEYLLQSGFDPLAAAAVAANMDIHMGWDRKVDLLPKGYACCFSGVVTVADVRAFARAPHKVKHKSDLKFGEGAGFGYRRFDGFAHLKYDSVMTQNTLVHYKSTNPQFASPKWSDGVQHFLAALFKKGKKAPALLVSEDLGYKINIAKVAN